MQNCCVSQPFTSIYGDGFTFEEMAAAIEDQTAQGFTSNPTLARSLGITDYQNFAADFCRRASPLSASVEVLSESRELILAEAQLLNGLGSNVSVKIPVVNSRGNSNLPVIRECWTLGIRVNVTAVFSKEQIAMVRDHCPPDATGYISVFAGRIADTGRDPLPYMKFATDTFADTSVRVIWASPREVYNIYQARELGVDVITVPFQFLGKLSLGNLNLDEFSRQTAEMFSNDARAANFKLSPQT